MRSMFREMAIVIGLCLAFVPIAVTALLSSTTFVGSHSLLAGMTPDQVADGATVAVRAVVVEQNARPARTRVGVVTSTTMKVQEVLKGSVANDLITVTSAGGKAGNVVEFAEDTEVFAVGEDVIVFLVPSREGGWQLYGGSQARFNVRGETARSAHAELSIAQLRKFAHR